eukprot:5897127-Lingulodinium_polyedra.AAC.1
MIPPAAAAAARSQADSWAACCHLSSPHRHAGLRRFRLARLLRVAGSRPRGRPWPRLRAPLGNACVGICSPRRRPVEVRPG